MFSQMLIYILEQSIAPRIMRRMKYLADYLSATVADIDNTNGGDPIQVQYMKGRASWKPVKNNLILYETMGMLQVRNTNLSLSVDNYDPVYNKYYVFVSCFPSYVVLDKMRSDELIRNDIDEYLILSSY